MKYSLQSLTDVAQCKSLLAEAAEQKSRLTAQKIFAEHAISKFVGTQLKLKTDLEKLTSELESLESMIKLADAGNITGWAADRKLIVGYKILLLTNSRGTQSAEDLLGKELKLAVLVQHLSVIDAFISEIGKRKAELKVVA